MGGFILVFRVTRQDEECLAYRDPFHIGSEIVVWVGASSIE